MPAPGFQWLKNGDEAFPAMLQAIAQAHHEVRLETYIFKDTGLGADFIAALLAARARGVKVQLMVDGISSGGLSEKSLAAMRTAGVEYRWFNPLSLSRWSVRDHRKLLACDRDIGFVGGFNIANEYRGDGITEGWRDLGLILRGKSVEALIASFDEMWGMAEYRHRVLNVLRKPALRRRFATPGCELLLSGPGRGFSPIKRSLREDLKRGREVRIYGAYFLPTWRIRRQLMKMARSGGKVQLILAGKSDVPVSRLASRNLYHRLLRSGVEIYEYQPQILHAKLILIDEVVYAGSANLDTRSLQINYELMARVVNANLAQEAHTMFEEDLTRCKRIDPATWNQQRGMFEKLEERWSYVLLARLDLFVARWQLRGMR